MEGMKDVDVEEDVVGRYPEPIVGEGLGYGKVVELRRCCPS